MDAVQQSVAKLQLLFTQRMDAYQDELQAASPSSNVVNLTADFTAFRTFIMTALRCLQDQVGLVVRQQDAMEMRSRRKILLIHGVPEDKDERTADVVAKAVVTHMKIPGFSRADIIRSHRVGRSSAPDKPRPILFKVRDLDARNKVWYGKTGLKGSGLTLSEFLTKARHDTFMMARQRFGIHKCWTKDGFVIILAAGTRKRISTLEELEKIALPAVPKPAAVAATSKESAAIVPKIKRAAVASKK